MLQHFSFWTLSSVSKQKRAKIIVPRKYIEEMIDENMSKPGWSRQVDEPDIGILIHEVEK